MKPHVKAKIGLYLVFAIFLAMIEFKPKWGWVSEFLTITLAVGGIFLGLKAFILQVAEKNKENDL